jgi:hypothetical protein
MSAFLQDKAHIDALVEASLRNYCGSSLNYYWQGEWKRVTSENADEIGLMLWGENYASVNYRYPDCEGHDLPGKVGNDWQSMLFYRYQPVRRSYSAVQILQAIRGYEYQSCEHPGWETSEAKAFCDALTHSMISRLPGYEDANTWSIPDDPEPVKVYEWHNPRTQGPLF